MASGQPDWEKFLVTDYPPFTDGSDKPPLSAAKRAEYIKFLQDYEKFGGTTVQDYNGVSDADLLAQEHAASDFIANQPAVAQNAKDQSPNLLQQLIGTSPNPVTGTTSPAGTAANGVVSATQSVASFLGNLSNPNLWVRVGEFAVGGILLVVGLNAALKNPAGKAAKIAKKL